MVVFNEPFSGGLKVNVNYGQLIVKATTLDGENLKVVETTTNEYRIDTPAVTPAEPYVIRLTIKRNATNNQKYSKALT